MFMKLLKIWVRFLYYSYSSSALILMELYQLTAAENLSHTLYSLSHESIKGVNMLVE